LTTRRKDNLEKAIDFFSARSPDPAFALAFAGLANVYIEWPTATLTPDKAIPKGKAWP
jgi:hypothetical protein